MVELEPDMFTANEVEPKARADEGCKGNAVDGDEVAETAEVDSKLKLGKELVDTVKPAELPAAVATDCFAEEARVPKGGTDGVDAVEAEAWVENKVDEAGVAEAVADAITLEVAPTKDDNGAGEEEEPKGNEKDFAAPVLEKRGTEDADEFAVEAMLPKPKGGWGAELPNEIAGCKVTAEKEVVLVAGEDRTVWRDGEELEELDEDRALPNVNEDVEDDGNILEKRVPVVVLDEVAEED